MTPRVHQRKWSFFSVDKYFFSSFYPNRNVIDPFKTNVYVIPKPKIIREYGPPLFDPTNNVDVRIASEKAKRENSQKKVEEKPKFVIKA